MSKNMDKKIGAIKAEKGMREIKFRFWSPSKKIMFYDYRLNAIDYSTVMGHWKLSEPDLPQSIYAKKNPHLFNAIKLQYTGLKDNNGKEIYEKDILEYNQTNYRAIVLWSNYHTGFVQRFDNVNHSVNNDFHPSSCKIIGNIYENPELLQEEQANEQKHRKED